jgi:hypothetical protein
MKRLLVALMAALILVLPALAAAPILKLLE